MDVIALFAERGDLAHLALFLWAAGASGLLAAVLRERAERTRRLDTLIGEIARLNRRISSSGED